MEVSEYPQLTIIMRGQSYEEAEAILAALVGVEDQFAIEMTLNTDNALQNITNLSKKYGEKIKIGAGTVRSLADAKAAIEAGAQFLLAPHNLEDEIFMYAKGKNILVVPAAMTPSEVNTMWQKGADIIKIFPAGIVTPKFFKDVQAPLGKLPLMAVGGVSATNAKEFLDYGASYLGLGSGMFNSEDIASCNIEGLRRSIDLLLESIRKEEK